MKRIFINWKILKNNIIRTILIILFLFMEKAIFWFRQDLRTYDNRWFIKAIKENDEILPIFILDKNLTDWFWWLEDKKFWFIREALEKLSDEIKELSSKELNVFFDFPEEIIPFLIKKYWVSKIYANKSYSRYWKKRDEEISKIANKLWCVFFLENDFLLVEPEKVEQRKVFTPFFKLWEKVEKDTQEIKPNNFNKLEIEENYKAKDFIKIQKHPYFTMDFWAKRLLNNIGKSYEEVRNDLDIDWTSKISPYLRFWIFSIRQIYNIWKENNSFKSELAWREFWQHIDYFFPFTKNLEFQENKRHIKWDNNEFLFQRWCEGKTGYPVVDACIKQLLETNRMHWRWRMIVASFLTKDLHIDWRLWEAFFKKHLLDYDENMNFWNWQWSASVWADPKPLRIFNPILQSEKFDKEAKFIKKYLPELEHENIEAIHNPLENNINYLKPIVDHREEQKIAREMYKWNLTNI